VTRDLIADLFDRYGPMVYQRALNMLRNPADAEEATQEETTEEVPQKETAEEKAPVKEEKSE